ncbi:hypothetical protein [Mycetocola reblochoni]|uniref:Uncharacterized protein n=2 Tax=Mycetocola reblochoni TaxID=331618 RepID=A0A1R4INW4_9MICO|nr:hypothetical protein [Mycetocola reblochoni]RLP67891.1 hypothetical protein D9V30_12190 [Mycetocola reblochoni]SJN21409.1 hypothetical protein FM119_02775 [Mycetocola reblochoni REB411]
MSENTTSRVRRGRRAVIAGTIAALAVTGVAVAPAQAQAAPAVSVQSATFGDGEWSPSHKESTRVIPLCKGPLAVASWLNVNFSDHGRDIQKYISKNAKTLERLATGKDTPLTTLALLNRAILQIPAYAISDGLFHLPATALSVVTGCGVLDRVGVNPFSSRS